MLSNENQTSLEKPEKKNDRFVRRTVLLTACVSILIVGVVLAKYITSNRQQAQMQSAQFHISSNYLEEGGNVSYEVADLSNGFDILLYNYEKENIAQISEVDMTYTVTAAHATVTVKDQNGADVTANAEGEYLFRKETGTAYHVLHVEPGNDIGNDTGITITVQTTSPYAKELKAIFNIQNNSTPDYKVTDQNDGTILITVKTNDYHGNMTITWAPDKYSPDNTNVLMSEWLDGTHTGTFSVSSNSTYELLFFKNTGDGYQPKTGTGTQITLE